MRKLLNIISGDLGLSIDCPYDKDNNKIDVYSSVYWSADSKKEYKKKESTISKWKYEDELMRAYAWCDFSGYDYWVVQQEEENYVGIDVYLKKRPEEYTQAEIRFIAAKIEGWDDYFATQLL